MRSWFLCAAASISAIPPGWTMYHFNGASHFVCLLVHQWTWVVSAFWLVINSDPLNICGSVCVNVCFQLPWVYMPGDKMAVNYSGTLGNSCWWFWGLGAALWRGHARSCPPATWAGFLTFSQCLCALLVTAVLVNMVAFGTYYFLNDKWCWTSDQKHLRNLNCLFIQNWAFYSFTMELWVLSAFWM